MALALAGALMACTNEDVPSPRAATVPAPAPDVTAPAPMPAPKVSEPGGPTARDSKASDPTDALTKREEQNAMPMPGQTDNHFSPSVSPKPDRS
jgi:hypothetical protein